MKVESFISCVRMRKKYITGNENLKNVVLLENKLFHEPNGTLIFVEILKFIVTGVYCLMFDSIRLFNLIKLSCG